MTRPFGSIPMRIASLESQHYALQILLFIKLKNGSYAEQMIREQFGEVTRPTIYRALWMLDSQDLIRSEVVEGPTGRGGLRRMWHLTVTGEEVATHLMAIEKALGATPKPDSKTKRNHKKKP